MFVMHSVFCIVVIIEAMVVYFFITGILDVKIKHKNMALLTGGLLYFLLTYSLWEMYELYIFCLYFMILLFCRLVMEGSILKHGCITICVIAVNVL